MLSDTRSRASVGAKILVLPTADLSGADDNALVFALRAGHSQAPRVVWQRFAGMVHRIARRSLGQTSDLEELVQEIFLNVFQRVSTLRDPRGLPYFIISVTNLTIRRELRRRRMRRWFHLGNARNDNQDQRTSQPDPKAGIASARFYGILDRLDSQDRMAFVLRSMEGMEMGEVARSLNLSLASTRRRIGRARAQIERHVQRDPALVEFVRDEGNKAS